MRRRRRRGRELRQRTLGPDKTAIREVGDRTEGSLLQTGNKEAKGGEAFEIRSVSKKRMPVN